MADEEGSEEKCKCPPGAPGWITTFSDLMSLLLAFFVLLFSFSELDKAIYKEVGGSLKNAFGVQREISSKDPLKGLHFIATEFSPGRPDPTALNEIRQETTNVLLRYLLARDAEEGEDEFEMKQYSSKDVLRKLAEIITEDAEKLTAEELKELMKRSEQVLEATAKELKTPPKDSSTSQNFEEGGLVIGEQSGGGDGSEDLTADRVVKEVEDFFQIQEEMLMQLELREDDSEKVVAKEFEEAIKDLEKDSDNNVEIARDVLQEFLKSAGKRQEEQKAFDITEEALREKLKEELAKGILELLSDRDQQRVTLFIKEKSSFDSGSAELKPAFLPVIKKISEVITKMQGIITISGHTDDRPIKTPRFRSNWELSASRAVSVTHALLGTSKIPPQRFQLKGHADTIPRATNKTSEGRATNRRVEISVVKARLTSDALDTIRETKVDVNTPDAQSLLNVKPKTEEKTKEKIVEAKKKVEIKEPVEAKPGSELTVEQIKEADPEDLGEFSVEYKGRPTELPDEKREERQIFKPFEIF